MTGYWVCVAHRWAVPPVAFAALAAGDAGAARHTEKAPRHPTLTTDRLDLADRLAGSDDACTGCGRRWDPDLEPSGGRTCPDCQRIDRRETTP